MDKDKIAWYVFKEDWGNKAIKTFNIFRHTHFREDCKKAFKKYKNDIPAIQKEIKSILMYNYWCKCEYEIVITSFPPKEDVGEKVDIYSQVMMNWDIFFNYLLENHKYL